MTDQEKQQQADETENQRPLKMDDQGPSYGSSINESTPGEITANRRRSLEDESGSTWRDDQE